MSRAARIATTSLTFAVVLLLTSSSHGASVTWTIDSTATSFGVSGTGKATLFGSPGNLRIVIQGTNPTATATPTIPIKLSGSLVTDTDFTSSIKFLSTGTIEGETTGNFQPKAGGVAGSEPADIGMTVQTKTVVGFQNIANLAWRDIAYDFSAPLAMAIVGSNVIVSNGAFSIVEGDLDFADVSGSGTLPLAEPLPGDATYDRIVDGGDYTRWADNYDPEHLNPGQKIYQGDFTADSFVDGGDYTVWADNYFATATPFLSAPSSTAIGSISKVGPNYTLSIPIQSTIYFLINEGAELGTTTDDAFLDLKFAGTLVATAPIPAEASAIPEPASLALALAAGICGCAWRIVRVRRRRP